MKNNVYTTLEEIFSKHYDEWCLLSYSYLENTKKAEDVVQDVCVNILLRKKAAKIENLQAYIATSVKNKSLKELKRVRKFETISDTNMGTSPSSEEDFILREGKLHLQNAISKLPEPCKRVFRLCVVEGQKYKTAADTLGISVNTVKYHIKKAYKTFRVEMGDVYFSIALAIAFFTQS